MEDKKNCCKGCQNGQPGQNKKCSARLLAQKLIENAEESNLIENISKNIKR